MARVPAVNTEERMTPRAGIQVAAAPLAAALLLRRRRLRCGAFRESAVPRRDRERSVQAHPPAGRQLRSGSSLTCPERGLNGLVAEEVVGKAQPEGRLCAVAETLLGWPGAEGDIPPENVLSVISSDFGLPQTVRKLLITTLNTAERKSSSDIPGLSEKDVAASIAEPIRNFAATAQVPRYGLVSERIKAGQTKVVLVMQDQNVELKPVPRKLNAGQTVALSGTVLGKLEKPAVQFTDAVGKLERVDAQGGKAFNAELKCGDRPGRMIVQIAAEQEGANAQVANFPVGCATDLPIAAAVATAGAKQVATTSPLRWRSRSRSR